jgi:hypothetical protein
VKNIQRGFKPSGIFEYFNLFEELLSAKGQPQSVDDVLCLKFLEKALAIRAAFKVKNTLTKVFTSKESEHEKINSIYAIDII